MKTITDDGVALTKRLKIAIAGCVVAVLATTIWSNFSLSHQISQARKIAEDARNEAEKSREIIVKNQVKIMQSQHDVETLKNAVNLLQTK